MQTAAKNGPMFDAIHQHPFREESRRWNGRYAEELGDDL